MSAKRFTVSPSLVRGYLEPRQDGSAIFGLTPGGAVAGPRARGMFLWRDTVPAPTDGEPWRLTTPWGVLEGDDAEALARQLVKTANAQAVSARTLTGDEQRARMDDLKEDRLATAPLFAAWWESKRKPS